MMKTSLKIFMLTLLLSSAWAQYPTEWVVDAHDFEHTMTLTGELLINGELQTELSSAVAVFHNDQCRGVVEGTQVGSEILFFLMIYGNTPGDSLEFRAWDARVGNVVPLEEEITFSSGAALGEVDTPYQLSGTNSVSHIQAFDDSFEQAEDTEFSVPFDILGNDIYDRSFAMMVTFPMEPQHGWLHENLDQTFTYISDLNFFGQDSFEYRVSHEYGADSAWVQVNITPVDDPLGAFHLFDPPHDTVFAFEGVIPYTFTWEEPAELDGDPLTYELYLYHEQVQPDMLDTNYFSNQPNVLVDLPLMEDDSYLWTVVAFDAWGFTAAADTFAFIVWRHVSVGDEPFIPTEFSVGKNYPNPFNPSTTIRYGLPEASKVSLVIYDVRGNHIQTLLSEHRSAGWHTEVWNGQTDDGSTLGTGIYIAHLIAGSHSQVVKMLYLK